MLQIKILKEVFNIDKNIEGYCLNGEVLEIGRKYNEEEIFNTDSDEIIVFSHRMSIIFDEKELARYVDIAEEIYEASNFSYVHICILIENSEVTVKEFNIPSDAHFTIKLCSIQNDEEDMLTKINKVITEIEEKIDKKEPISNEEIEMIGILPTIVPKELKNEMRIKSLKILNKVKNIDNDD